MNSNQRAEFEVVLEKLYAGYNMPISKARIGAYWDGLAKMSLGQFSAAIDYALGENGPERIPPVSAIWKMSKQLRVNAPQPYKPVEIDQQPKALRVVNGLFLKYLLKRRMTEGFKGDLDMPRRRKACLDLADWLSEWTEKEMSSQIREIERMFNAAMAQVSDKAA